MQRGWKQGHAGGEGAHDGQIKAGLCEEEEEEEGDEGASLLKEAL